MLNHSAYAALQLISFGIDLKHDVSNWCSFLICLCWGLPMNVGEALFAQIMYFDPWTSFPSFPIAKQAMPWCTE